MLSLGASGVIRIAAFITVLGVVEICTLKLAPSIEEFESYGDRTAFDATGGPWQKNEMEKSVLQS